VNQPLVNSVYDILTIAIVIMGLFLVVLDVRYFRQTHYWQRWLRLICGVMGLYWAVLYVFIFFSADEGVPWLGPTFVRPGILLTLAIMAANTIAAREPRQ
jgi:hypothetical protein